MIKISNDYIINDFDSVMMYKGILNQNNKSKSKDKTTVM